MSAVLYPVAANATAALNAPVGRASRASEAAVLAGASVVFVTETAGPAFPTRVAALDAFAGRVDDERPGAGGSVQPQDRYCELRELAQAAPPKPGSKAPPAWLVTVAKIVPLPPSVPLLMVTGLLDSTPFTNTIPPLTVVPPEQVLVADKMIVPKEPAVVNPPVPLMME